MAEFTDEMTPREIVAELDKYIVGQKNAKRAVAVALRNRYRVVHIASHFSFQPGNETLSYLLLGDGTKLSVADLKALPPSEGVDLLTLSACNTGVGSENAEGKEVEGLGVQAQNKIAKAVLASLWEVSDESTSLLMQNFYRFREAEPGVTKAEALRRAQLAMLRGDTKRSEDGGETRGAGTANANARKDSRARFAHPYYWSAFFLIGNWL